jgi:TolB-like protein
MIRTVCLILSALIVSSAGAGQKSVGVLPFTNNCIANREKMQPLSLGLADMLSTGLSQVKSLRVVERAGLQKVLAEIALAQSGVMDESQTKEAGKMAGADVLLLGSYNLGYDGTIRIDARLVDVETGAALKAEEVTGPKKKIFELVSRLVFKLASNLASSISAAEKKAIEKKETAGFDAFVAYAQGVSAETAGDTASARACYSRALELSKKYGAAKARLAALTPGASQ